jgi:hypothetical protein
MLKRQTSPFHYGSKFLAVTIALLQSWNRLAHLARFTRYNTTLCNKVCQISLKLLKGVLKRGSQRGTQKGYSKDVIRRTDNIQVKENIGPQTR